MAGAPAAILECATMLPMEDTQDTQGKEGVRRAGSLLGTVRMPETDGVDL